VLTAHQMGHYRSVSDSLIKVNCKVNIVIKFWVHIQIDNSSSYWHHRRKLQPSAISNHLCAKCCCMPAHRDPEGIFCLIVILFIGIETLLYLALWTSSCVMCSFSCGLSAWCMGQGTISYDPCHMPQKHVISLVNYPVTVCIGVTSAVRLPLSTWAMNLLLLLLKL
jgi:hypothetical protein